MAVTSGLRSGYMFLSSLDGGTATLTYEARKRSFLDTHNHCKSEGIHLHPFVLEAAGGSFGPSARRVLSLFANSAAKLTGECSSQKVEQFSQRLSLILHETNARSILLRACLDVDPPASLSAARSILEKAEIARRSNVAMSTQ